MLVSPQEELSSFMSILSINFYSVEYCIVWGKHCLYGGCTSWYKDDDAMKPAAGLVNSLAV